MGNITDAQFEEMTRLSIGQKAALWVDDTWRATRKGDHGRIAQAAIVAPGHFLGGVQRGLGGLSRGFFFEENTLSTFFRGNAEVLEPEIRGDDPTAVRWTATISNFTGQMLGPTGPLGKAGQVLGKGASFLGKGVSAVRASAVGRAVLAVMPTVTQAGKAAQLGKVQTTLQTQGFTVVGGTARTLVQPQHWYNVWGHTKNLFGFRTYATRMERAGGGAAHVNGHIFNVGHDANVTAGLLRPHVARLGGKVGPAGTQKFTLLETVAPGWWESAKLATLPIRTAWAPFGWIGRHPRLATAGAAGGVAVDGVTNDFGYTKAAVGFVGGKVKDAAVDQITDNPENVAAALAMGALFGRMFGFLGGLVGAVIGYFGIDHIIEYFNPTPAPPPPPTVGEWASQKWDGTKSFLRDRWEDIVGPGGDEAQPATRRTRRAHRRPGQSQVFGDAAGVLETQSDQGPAAFRTAARHRGRPGARGERERGSRNGRSAPALDAG